MARMEAKALHAAPIWCADVKEFGGSPWNGCVDILTAGYPCQPFSASGKRRGQRDPRHLRPSIREAIAGIEPGIVYLENVAGHLSLGFETVVAELEGMGYATTAGLFSSAEVGASHRRERLFFLANAERSRAYQQKASKPNGEGAATAATGTAMARHHG